MNPIPKGLTQARVKPVEYVPFIPLHQSPTSSNNNLYEISITCSRCKAKPHNLLLFPSSAPISAPAAQEASTLGATAPGRLWGWGMKNCIGLLHKQPAVALLGQLTPLSFKKPLQVSCSLTPCQGEKIDSSQSPLNCWGCHQSPNKFS